MPRITRRLRQVADDRLRGPADRAQSGALAAGALKSIWKRESAFDYILMRYRFATVIGSDPALVAGPVQQRLALPRRARAAPRSQLPDGLAGYALIKALDPGVPYPRLGPGGPRGRSVAFSRNGRGRPG